ncbi:hypothetical protein D3C80_2100260 [compost metagenome]
MQLIKTAEKKSTASTFLIPKRRGYGVCWWTLTIADKATRFLLKIMRSCGSLFMGRTLTIVR